MVTKIKIQFDLSLVSNRKSLEKYGNRWFDSEVKLLKSLDRLGIEDVSFQDLSLLETAHGKVKLPMMAMFIFFDHPKDAAKFEQHFSEMIVR